MILAMKQKQSHRHREQTCCQRERGGGRDGLGLGDSRKPVGTTTVLFLGGQPSPELLQLMLVHEPLALQRRPFLLFMLLFQAVQY